MKKTRLLTAVSALVVSLALLVGGTYALFTDDAKVTNHLKAGDMNITLIRTDYTQNMVNGQGYVVDMTPEGHDVDVPFTTATNLNMFGLTSEQVFVPGSSVSADLRIANSAQQSDVAFCYWITIKLQDVANPVELASVLQVDVTVDGRSDLGIDGELLSAGYSNSNGEFTIGTAASPIGTLPLGGTQDFTVTVTMLDTAGNNTKNQEVKFDLIINASQVLTAPAA